MVLFDLLFRQLEIKMVIQTFPNVLNRSYPISRDIRSVVMCVPETKFAPGIIEEPRNRNSCVRFVET